MMVPYAVNWQIKETLRSSPDSPRTDLARRVRVVHAGGYRGYLPIEALAMKWKDHDPAAEVVRVLADLRRAIAAVG